MGLNESQGQLGDVEGELFEAAVFLSPLFDLGEEVDGDVSGVGFAFDLPGQIVAGVFAATGAAAVGITTSAASADQSSGQDGAFGLELLLACQQEAAEEGGMLWNFHRGMAILNVLILIRIKAYQLQVQKSVLRQLFPGGVTAAEDQTSVAGRIRPLIDLNGESLEPHAGRAEELPGFRPG
jgi:hypothetical protein